MKTTEKTVCIYTDTAHETAMQKAFNEALQKIVNAVQRYNDITGEPLPVEQWHQFMNTPVETTLTVLREKINVPDGFKREKYFELMELPDLSNLYFSHKFSEPPYSTELCRPEFYIYDGQTVSLSDVAIRTITTKNVYVSESDYKFYLKLQKFVKLAKELQKENERFDYFLNPNFYNYGDVISMIRAPFDIKINPVAFEIFARSNTTKNLK